MIVLLPCYSLEDFSIYRTPEESNQIFSAWSALYHPALLEAAGKLPEWERAGNPLSGRQHGLIIIPPCCEAQVPSAWLTEMEKTGATIVRHRENRDKIVAAALSGLGLSDHGFSDEWVETFLAMGFVRFASELLTRKLRYMTNLDTRNFELKTLAAVEAARQGEKADSNDAIRRAFELLAEAKQYFFPTAMRMFSLTWLSRDTLGEPLGAMLTQRRVRGEPTHLVLPTFYLERMEQEHPETVLLLREEIAAERLSILGGDADESPLYLLPPVEIAARLRAGLETYQRILNGRPTIFGRNSAGYAVLLPRLLAMTGYDATLFFTRDGWHPKPETQSRLEWTGPDGAKIRALVRTPLDGESDKSFMELSDRIGYGSNADDTPTLLFEHRPNRLRVWYTDLVRSNRYAHVIGQTESMAEYFAAWGARGHKKHFEKEDFRTNFLTRAAADGRANPISHWVEYYRLIGAKNALRTLTLFAGLESSKRRLNGLPNFTNLSETAAPLSDFKRRLEANLFEPIPLATDFDDESQRGEMLAKIGREQRTRADLLEADFTANDSVGSERVRREKLDIPSAAMLHRVLARRAADESSLQKPRGVFLVNPTSVPQTVALDSSVVVATEIVAPEVAPLIKASAEGGTVVTLPPFAAGWIPTLPAAPNASNPSSEESPKRPGILRRWKNSLRRTADDVPMSGVTIERRRDEFSDGRHHTLLLVRNRFLELAIDEPTGQVHSIKTFSAPAIHASRGILSQPAMGNRLAWQIALRLSPHERAADLRAHDSAAHGYTLMATDTIETVESSPHRATLRLTGRLMTPDGRLASDFVQTISLERDARLIDVEIQLGPTLLPTDNPWENYYGVRFAWNDHLAELQAGLHGAFWPTHRDYLQAPEAVDIRSEPKVGVTILTGGLAFHRRRGTRRLDTILLPKNESRRTFRFGVGVDLPDPLAAAVRFLAPRPMVLYDQPAIKRSLLMPWVVEPARVLPVLLEPFYGDGKSEANAALAGFTMTLQETAGKKADATVSTRYAIQSVRAVDFLGREEKTIPLTDPQSFRVACPSHGIVRLEVRLK